MLSSLSHILNVLLLEILKKSFVISFLKYCLLTLELKFNDNPMFSLRSLKVKSGKS